MNGGRVILNSLFPDKLWNYKNFNMVTELDIAGEFIYDGVHMLNQIEVINQDSMLFSFLYHVSIGIERLQKIVLVLWEKVELDTHEEFEKSLITHSHIALNERICRNANLKMNIRENDFLQMLSIFYKSARYNRFNLESQYSREQKMLAKFIEKYISLDKLQYHFITNKILISNDVKELLGRVIGGLSKKYYQLVYEGCAKNQTYTYELRSGSKAEKIFLSNYPKNSLQRQKIDERVALKELLVYFRNFKDSNSFTRFLDGIEPLELDIGLVNEYIQEICKGIVPQSLIDEVEYLYEENEYSVERLKMVDAIGNTDIIFDMQDIHQCFLLMDDLVNGSHNCKKFAEVFPEKLEMVEDGCIDEVLEGIAEICKKFLEGKIESASFIIEIKSYYTKFVKFYNYEQDDADI